MVSNEALNSIEKVGFVLRPDSLEILSLYREVSTKFTDKKIEVFLECESAEMIGLEGIDFDEMCNKVDLLVSLGGDGTLLGLVRRSYGFDKPVMGINAGNLGFLADIPIDCVDEMIEKLLLGNYRVDDRMMIEGYIEHDGGRRDEFYAFNDVVITRPSIAHMIKLDAFIDNAWFNTYRGDGLIISTPTGSTAYNLSLGGPIVYPLSKVFIMTPVAPHSLTQRPLVVPSDFTIKLTSPDELVVMIDGQDNYRLKNSDRLVIKGASMSAKLLHKKEHSYFKVLREKLSWGDE
jgi:NAD+ kinase